MNTSKGHILLEVFDSSERSYVEVLEDGRVRAGYFRDTAKTYNTAEEAYARFKEAITFNKDNQSAWRICAALEEHMTHRDDGC